MTLTRRCLLASLPALALPLPAASRKMRISLSPGAISLKVTQLEAIDAAAKYGFEAVDPDAAWLTNAGDSGIGQAKEALQKGNLSWAAAGLPVEFRRDEAKFKDDLSALPGTAKALQKAGVTRVGTWVLSTSPELAYLPNMKQHASRLREAAKILGDHGMRLGMEYLGPKTIWASSRFPFIHSMGEMQQLMAEIGTSNIGLVLDSWHWYTAGEKPDLIRTLKAPDVISVDLNDAPVNIAVDQQIDSKRELPLATGVIDASGFLNALNDIGYDGPVRCEPFNSTLRVMQRDEVLAVVSASMKRAFALVKA